MKVMELWKWWSYGVMELWSYGSGGAMEATAVEEDIYENPSLSHIKKAEASSFQVVTNGNSW